jgi:hypothetical protein
MDEVDGVDRVDDGGKDHKDRKDKRRQERSGGGLVVGWGESLAHHERWWFIGTKHPIYGGCIGCKGCDFGRFWTIVTDSWTVLDVTGR